MFNSRIYVYTIANQGSRRRRGSYTIADQGSAERSEAGSYSLTTDI